MLQLQGITKTYRRGEQRITAVRDVDLSLQPGDFVALRGPSGCGKSTLLLTAGGLLAPTQGTVLFDGRNPYELSADARAALRATGIGFVFQQFHLVPYLSVLDNVRVAAAASRKTEARDRAVTLIEHFGLADRMHHTPGELSTGERQRTALARALLNEPRLLLADEPTGNLDEANAATVLDELARFAQAGGAVLLVTHDARAAARATTTLHMRDGQLVEPVPSETPEPVLQS